ncbi:hypothetical protein [Mycolicibacterium obuense]|uniref:Secreted protein n=1 Tax=Mycolicibacterium obuense TaxID=1807 RepID=A0A0J6WBM7_9MYCO|nr:hypothetical protein [Mycolicibacterium obuense]KKE99219.1 hypothetical protein WN67_25105 [Mycolicibacterium obuense]KMO79964.1 hypothetical protein MOBUDSM44075_01097 [Mycolicibacterium obuense]OKH64572.1 hypothetical protein EB72_08785 [Mycobacterium sp. SWH-M1]
MYRATRAAVATATLLIAAPLFAAVATADDSVVSMPFSEKLRRCDFTQVKYVGGSGYGRPSAQLRVQGGEVIADVEFFTGVPNTAYDLRLIQLPRSSAADCGAGAPGVSATTLFTDGVGTGHATVRGPLMPGATGAWLEMTRPGTFSQKPDEFYTTDLIATLSSAA